MNTRTNPELTEIHLLRKEIETVGELATHEQLERRSEMDLLKIRFEALKKVLEQEVPNFSQRYEAAFQELIQTFDPESESEQSLPKTGT